jgi:hypothetical protein
MPGIKLPDDPKLPERWSIAIDVLNHFGAGIDKKSLEEEILKIRDTFNNLPQEERTPRRYFTMSWTMIDEKFPSYKNFLEQKLKTTTENIREISITEATFGNTLTARTISDDKNFLEVNGDEQRTAEGNWLEKLQKHTNSVAENEAWNKNSWKNSYARGLSEIARKNFSSKINFHAEASSFLRDTHDIKYDGQIYNVSEEIWNRTKSYGQNRKFILTEKEKAQTWKQYLPIKKKKGKIIVW